MIGKTLAHYKIVEKTGAGARRAASGAAAALLGLFVAGCAGFREMPLLPPDAPPPKLIEKEVRLHLDDGRVLSFVVARESADSLWASEYLSPPPAPSVARSDITRLEVSRFNWLKTSVVLAGIFLGAQAAFGLLPPFD